MDPDLSIRKNNSFWAETGLDMPVKKKAKAIIAIEVILTWYFIMNECLKISN